MTTTATEPTTTTSTTTTPAAGVNPLTTSGNVRKWRRVLVGISDWADPKIPLPTTAEQLFDIAGGTYKPLPLPAGVKDMGFIDTNGLAWNKSVKSDGTNMLQQITPVRTDVTDMEETFQVIFGESNAWTNAIYHGLQVSQWAADKNAAWLMADGNITDFPYYTLWTLSQDGIGNQAIYRIEIVVKAKTSALGARKMNATDAETFDNTWSAFSDDATGLFAIRAEEGPGRAQHLVAGQSLLMAA